MGLGSLFHRDRIITQTDTVTGETITDLVVTGMGAYPQFGNAGAYRGGMGVPGAWRAAVLLADLIGAAPWHAYREAPGGVDERVVPTPSLLDQPAPPDQRVATFSSMALDLLWHGNAIALRVGLDGEGSADAMLPVPAESVFVDRVGPHSETELPIGNVAYHVGGRWFDASEVIHVKGPCQPGALRGWGVLEAHEPTLRLSEEQRRQAASATGEGIPTGVLTSSSPDTTKEQLTAAKAAWMAAQRTRTIAALGPGTSFEALGWNPTEAQLLDARRFTLHEIGLIFGVPLSFLGVEGGSRTYSNVEQEGLNLIKFSLAGHLARFEQALSAALPGRRAKANLDAVLRSDTLTRYQAHEIAIRSKFLAPSEVRGIEDRRPFTPEQLDEFPESAPATPPPTDPPDAPPAVGADDPDGEDGERSEHRDEADLFLYWVSGKGRAKWTGKAEPLRALYDQLVEHMPREQARRTALAWFADGMGRKPKQSDGQLPDPEPIEEE